MEVRFSKWFQTSDVENAKRLGLKTFYGRSAQLIGFKRF